MGKGDEGGVSTSCEKILIVKPLLVTDKPCASVTLIVKVWPFPETVGVPCTVTALVVLPLSINPVGAAIIAHV